MAAGLEKIPLARFEQSDAAGAFGGGDSGGGCVTTGKAAVLRDIILTIDDEAAEAAPVVWSSPEQCLSLLVIGFAVLIHHADRNVTRRAVLQGDEFPAVVVCDAHIAFISQVALRRAFSRGRVCFGGFLSDVFGDSHVFRW